MMISIIIMGYLKQLMFADEVKYFSLKNVWKKTLFKIFVTRVYSWTYFWPKE